MPDIQLFQIQDAHGIMNDLVSMATGQAANIKAIDTTTFVDAGKTLLAQEKENVLQSLSVLIAKTLTTAKPYTAKFKLIYEQNSDIFENKIRKIDIYARENDAAGAFNTNLYTNIADGQDDSDGAESQWTQHLPITIERYFGNSFAWKKKTTTLLKQMQQAFTDEASFVAWVNGVMTEVANDIESTIEARNRMAVLDRIAGQYAQATDTSNDRIGLETAVNLTAEINNEFGTEYTTEEILQEHNKEFLEYLSARIQIDSDRLTERTALYHDPLTKTISGKDYKVLRHTPKSDQKFIYYKPLFTMAKAKVLPEIFNPQYIAEMNGEGVNFWQDIKHPTQVKCKPALPDGAESSTQTLSYVVGMLFSKDALFANNKFEGAYSTPVNAEKLYYNTVYHYLYGLCNDYSEPAIVYYMADES